MITVRHPLDRERSCTGKMQFASKAAAHEHLSHHGKLKAPPQYRGRGRMEAYGCEWCGLWHVGHTPRPKGSR